MQILYQANHDASCGCRNEMICGRVTMAAKLQMIVKNHSDLDTIFKDCEVDFMWQTKYSEQKN